MMQLDHVSLILYCVDRRNQIDVQEYTGKGRSKTKLLEDDLFFSSND